MIIDGYCTLGVDREYDLTAEGLLRALDQAEVDRAVIAPVDRCLAVENRAGNDDMLAAARAHPNRFIPACAVNPWYGSKAVDELRRSLAAGARMLILHPLVQGFVADDELVWPILEAVAGKGVPVYIHTGPPGSATPWQIVHLAERYPTVDFIMGHCGATDFRSDAILAGRSVDNITLESSLARPPVFLSHVQTLGAKRGIMGSAAPLNDLVFEWRETRAVLPPAEWGDVYGGNLLRLLTKGGPL
jgi:uncharacterized protein